MVTVPCAIPWEEIMGVFGSPKHDVSIRICVWITGTEHQLEELSSTLLGHGFHPEGHRRDTSNDFK